MRTMIVILALGACSQQPAEQPHDSASGSPPAPAATAAAPVQQAAMVSLPKDPVQLKRLEAMGYSVHEDHLHAPGVSSCPKMGDDPVM